MPRSSPKVVRRRSAVIVVIAAAASCPALHALWGTGSRLWAVGEHGTILVKTLD